MPTEIVGSITPAWIDSQVTEYLADDVFRLEFLRGVILTTAADDQIEISESTRKCLRSKGTNWIQAIPQKLAAAAFLRDGPGVVMNGYFHEVWRVYSDTNGTLLTALKPSSER